MAQSGAPRPTLLKVAAWAAGLFLLAMVAVAGWILAIDAGLGWPDPPWRREPVQVSMIQLIANPGRRDGRIVRTIGYLHLEFEGQMLCPSREFFEKDDARDCLWIDAPRNAAALSDHYVIVEGRFRAKDRGHMGMFGGALRDVTRVELWEHADRRG